MLRNFLRKYLSVNTKRKIYILGEYLKKKWYFLFSFFPTKLWNSKEHKLVFENRRSYLYIICPYGIGDILVGKMLANKIRKNKKKLVFLVRENYFSLNNVLREEGECIFDTKKAREIEKYILEKQKFQGQNYIYGHFPKKEDYSIFFGLNMNDFVWQDYCKYVYGVEKNSLFHIVDITDFGKNVSDLKMIIICPYAYSTGILPKVFWEELVKILVEKDYVIYTNVSKTEEEISGTKRLECTLSEISDLANQAFAVIAMRSGICDLLAIESLATLYIINESERLEKYWNLEYLRARGIYNFLVTDHLVEDILQKLEENYDICNKLCE